MEDRLSKALQAASTDAPVLLSGQPGTGKEPLARAIHKASARRDQPFTSLACTSVAGEDLAALLAESTGTLYLDEIADLDLQAQTSLAKLLASGPEGTGPRLVAASARDLSGAIAKGFFREDLYYRLGVVQIDLPPLSQRREDIPLLAVHFLAELARTDERHVFAPEAVELLMSAEWPGNGAQLFNLVRQAAALAAGPVISAEIVQQTLGGRGAARVPTFDEAREEFTRTYLAQLLQITRGNVTQAAKLAGRNRTDFYKLLGRHGVQPEEFKGR
jgi:two-component system response regulator GlrR